jgi:hypothetical protein
MNIFIKERIQFLVFGYLSLAVAVLTLILYFIDSSPFHRFLGNINPLVLLLISIVAGFSLLTYLISNTGFTIYKKGDIKRYSIIAGIALVFGIEVIAADIWLVEYPADINILFPESLLFYPVIGYIVEVFFHLLPISLIIMFLSVFRKLSLNKIIWISIITVSILEPLYQIWFTSKGSYFTMIYTGIHVFLFSLTQLLIFKRYDFISMYLFRIVFYSIWHILWGHFRLDLLF